MGIDGLARRAEDRGIHAGGKGDAERIVRRDADHARARADEFRQVVRVAADDVVSAHLPQQRGFHQPHPGRHKARRAVGVTLQFPPLRVLLVNHLLHLHRHRCQCHLDEVTRVIDGLRQRSCKDNWLAAPSFIPASSVLRSILASDADALQDLLACAIAREVEFVVRLQIHPELRRGGEMPRRSLTIS